MIMMFEICSNVKTHAYGSVRKIDKIINWIMDTAMGVKNYQRLPVLVLIPLTVLHGLRYELNKAMCKRYGHHWRFTFCSRCKQYK